MKNVSTSNLWLKVAVRKGYHEGRNTHLRRKRSTGSRCVVPEPVRPEFSGGIAAGNKILCSEGPLMSACIRGEEELFKVEFCLPEGPYATDEDVRYILDCIREGIY